MQIVKKLASKIRMMKNQDGFTLIEAVIGIALLSIVAVAILMGVTTAFKTNAVADKQSTAMSLAVSQAEALQTQPYQDTSGKVHDAMYTAIDPSTMPGYTNFTIGSYDRNGTFVADMRGLPWKTSSANDVGVDDGLQKITIAVKQGNSVVLTLSTYKVQ